MSSSDKSLCLWLFWERTSYRYCKHFIIFKKKKKNWFKRLKLYFMEQKTFFKCKHPNSSREVHSGSTRCRVKEAMRGPSQNDGCGYWRQLQATANTGKGLLSPPFECLSPTFFGTEQWEGFQAGACISSRLGPRLSQPCWTQTPRQSPSSIPACFPARR